MKQCYFFLWRGGGWKRRDSLGFYSIRVLLYNSDATMEVSTEFQYKQGTIKSHTFRDLAIKSILSLIKWPLHFESNYKNCKECLPPFLVRMNFVCASDYRIINRVLNSIKIRRLIED